MNPIAVKLNYKTPMEALVVHPPEGLMDWAEVFDRFRTFPDLEGGPAGTDPVSFALVFVFGKEDPRIVMDWLAQRLEGDAVLWMCYPKKTSRRFKAALDRDHGWDALGERGYEPVRQVALDEDFSVLRFRKVEFIKKMVRSEGMRLTKPQSGS